MEQDDGGGGDHAGDGSPPIPDAILNVVRSIESSAYEERTKREAREAQQQENERKLTEYTGAVSWWTKVLGVAAIASAAITLLQWQALHEANETAIQAAQAAERAVDVTRQAMINENRAWIIPGEVKITQYEIGKHLLFTIPYYNGGKAPAINVRHREHVEAIPSERFGWRGRAWIAGKLPYRDTCDAIEKEDAGRNPESRQRGIVVYPSGPSRLLWVNGSDMGRSDLSDTMEAIEKGGKEAIAIFGCFTYTTIDDTIRKSPWCAYIRSPVDDKPTVESCPFDIVTPN